MSDNRVYYCHACNWEGTLIDPNTVICARCNSDFLEEVRILQLFVLI